MTEPEDPHEWDDNYFCANKPGARWSHSGQLEGLRCVGINEPGDRNSWSDNYLCTSPHWREEFKWSSAGPLEKHRCIAVNEPSDPNGWSDNFLCWTGGARNQPALKNIKIELSKIDDDAYVWIGDRPGNTSEAICSAHYANDTEGEAPCDLTPLVDSNGLEHEQKFIVKFGNGGRMNSQGSLKVFADGREVFSKRKLRVIRHEGWFYRVVLLVDFVRGTVRVVEEDECRGQLDCMN
jgi:hypothetical protein